MTETRSPLKDKPLRNPGQSVRRARLDIVFDQLMAPLLVTTVFVTWALIEWVRYWLPVATAPWLATAIALTGAGYLGFQVRRYWPQLVALQLAEDGEKAVGQFLESLREKGYQVFHDIVTDDFNVDHVLIGPAGVFTIETKTWSKPIRGKAEIEFDGETLKAGGCTPDRDPVVQALAQAAWLKRLLTDSTGKSFPVRPVVLFPGWYVKDSRSSRKELWVLEPKALSAFLSNEPDAMTAEDAKLAAYHLSRFIREQERVLEARK